MHRTARVRLERTALRSCCRVMAPPVSASAMTPERRAQLEAVLAREQEKSKLQNKARAPAARPVRATAPPLTTSSR
jgi:hypothetical protein